MQSFAARVYDMNRCAHPRHGRGEIVSQHPPATFERFDFRKSAWPQGAGRCCDYCFAMHVNFHRQKERFKGTNFDQLDHMAWDVVRKKNL